MSESKKLYLIRHAKSSREDSSLSDFERPLNKRGKRDAPLMGLRLKNKNVMPDMIISSPAVRAKTTAKLIAKEIGFKEAITYSDRIYEASSDDLFHVLTAVDEKVNTLFLIGHNPSLNILAEELVHFDENIPTCGILEIEFNAKKWKEINFSNATLLSFDYPKKSEQ